MYLLCLGSHQPYHYSLLSVESVLGLVEDLVRMLLEYLCGDLFLAVSGQAVHYHSVGLSGSHYSVVDLIALEYLAALSGFALLTHGSPYVCVNHVGVSGSFDRVADYLELSGDAEYQHFIDTLGREGFPGGETTEAFKARTVEAFQEVWKEISSQTEQGIDRTLVFVVHGGTIMAVMEAFSEEKKSYYDWQVGNGEGVLGKMDASDGQIRNARIIKAK